jgi:outer membrane protein
MRQMVTVLAVVLGSATIAKAQEKIGFVDVERAINETNEGQSAKKKLKSKFETRQKELDEKSNELNKQKQDLDKQRTILKADVLAAREKDLGEKFVQLQQTYLRLQKELSQDEATTMNPILQKIHKIGADIAQQEGFGMVLEKSQVFWARPSLDLTNEVIRRYNTGAGGASPGGSPKTGSKK